MALIVFLAIVPATAQATPDGSHESRDNSEGASEAALIEYGRRQARCSDLSEILHKLSPKPKQGLNHKDVRSLLFLHSATAIDEAAYFDFQHEERVRQTAILQKSLNDVQALNRYVEASSREVERCLSLTEGPVGRSLRDTIHQLIHKIRMSHGNSTDASQSTNGP